jgi:ankyrin repeat protein
MTAHPTITRAEMVVAALRNNPEVPRLNAGQGSTLVQAISPSDLADLPDVDRDRLWLYIRSASIHVAASFGSTDFIREALRYSDSAIDLKDPQGMTPLVLAALHRKIDIVRLLLGSSQRAQLLAFADSNQRTVLHYAAHAGDPEIIRVLLASGAKPDALDTDSRPPFECCIRPIRTHGRLTDGTEGMKAFMEHASWKQIRGLSLYDPEHAGKRGTYDGWLHEAVGAGHLGAMEVLISDGFDVNGARSPDGATPLHTACAYVQPAALRVLLDNGADPNRAWKGRSPLNIILTYGSPAAKSTELKDSCRDMLATLLEAGCDPAIPDETGATPMIVSSSTPDLQAVFHAYASRKAMQSAVRKPGVRPN